MKQCLRTIVAACLSLTAGAGIISAAEAQTQIQLSQTSFLKAELPGAAQAANPKADVPYVPTPEVVVMEMLQLAKVGREDVVFDLGSGDGRIVINAAQKFGARGVGIELDPNLVAKSRENARAAGVRDRVQFVQQNLFDADLSSATVVMVYLFPDVNKRLLPKLLRELKPGTRIVSHNYDLGSWEPKEVVQVRSHGYEHTVYLWVVPEKIPDNLIPNSKSHSNSTGGSD